MPQDRIALDRASVRTKDQDGHLHVELANISKAAVNPYYGREIPGGEALGLRPDQLYQLLRDPAELEKAVATFNGKPLLIVHKPQTASDHDHELVAGSVSNCVWQPPYLKAQLDIWDGDAIAMIESGEQRQLSSGYRYEADMTPGTYEGVEYHGVMRRIFGNHVAIVAEGRAGPDVFVGDSKPAPPLEMKDFPMAKQTASALSRKALLASGALRAYLAPKMAADAKLPDMKPILGDVTARNWKAVKPKIEARLATATTGKLAADASLQDVVALLDQLDDVTDEMADVPLAAAPTDPAEDGDAEMMEKVRAILGPDADDTKVKALCDLMKPAAAIDADPKPDIKEVKKEGDEPKVGKAAMDAAIGAAVQKAARDAEASTMARLGAIREAEREVAPWVGDIAIAQDSAEAVYRLALDSLGVDVKDVPAPALPHILRAQPKPSDAPKNKPRIGMDAAAAKGFSQRFPNAVPHRSV